MARVIVVSNFAAVRTGLRALLADRSGLSIVGDVAGSSDLRLLLADSCAEVVLWDFFEPELLDVSAAAAETATSLVLIGADTTVLERLAQSGVATWAAVPRDAEPDEIAAAVAAVSSGLIALPPSSLAALLEGAVTTRVGLQSKPQGLSVREQEILQLMAEGLPNKQIAARLSVSLHTVKFHAAAIFTKLGVGSRTEAVTVGVKRGLVLL